MRKERNKQNPVMLLLAAAAVVGIAVLLLCLLPGTKTEEDPQLQAGLSYLEQREQQSPDGVIQVRKEIRQRKLDAQRDALVAELTSGAKAPFSMFSDYAVMGDSRAVGFWYFDYLDKDRVYADGGHTIRNLQEEIPQVAARNPATVYLCYGLNDISIGYWDTSEEYVAEYMKAIEELQSQLPDATIVVSSILPAMEQAFATSSRWRDIPEWSRALGEACRERGILFADCDSLAQEYPNLWDPVDGIHFRREFYPYWASILVVTTLMEEAS